MNKKNKTQSEAPIKEELLAIEAIVEILNPFNLWAQERILDFVCSRKHETNVWGEGGRSKDEDAAKVRGKGKGVKQQQLTIEGEEDGADRTTDTEV